MELADAESARTIWGDRYDGDLDDIFTMQDEITHRIVAATAVHIEASEAERMRQTVHGAEAGVSKGHACEQAAFGYGFTAGEVGADMAVSRATFQQNLRNELTPEQWEEWQALHARFAGAMGHHGREFGGPGPGRRGSR